MKNKNIQNYIEFYALLALIWLLKKLPYRLARSFVLGLFDLVGYRFGIRKKVAYTQLSKVFPEKSRGEINKILREIYRQMALNILEVYLMDDATLNSSSYIIGDEFADEAFKMERGVILATAHFGNWEAARILPLKGIALSVITKKQRNHLFDDYTNQIRRRSGLRTIDMKRGLRDIISDLKENRMVAILADQNAGSAGMIMDFLGFPASHWKGVAKLSLRYKIPILPGFVLRNEDDSLRFEFSQMLHSPDLDDSEENYERVLKDIISVTESYIRRYPEHWFWVHKRWKKAYDMFA